MAKRHRDALFIQEGACNPSGISRALNEACKECIAEGVSQREDVAVRLILHQLNWIVFGRDVCATADPLFMWQQAMDECKKRSSETA